jgi:hypothetical protein
MGARKSGPQSRIFCQRVEDNAFHLRAELKAKGGSARRGGTMTETIAEGLL